MFNSEKIKDLLSPKFYENKIRLGQQSDGGYVVSKDHLCKHLISIGCNNSTTFEEDYLKLIDDAKIDIYDGAGSCDLATKDNRVLFHNKYVNGIKDLNISEKCVVQLDIEGAELSFFNDDTSLNLIEQLIIEVHFHHEVYPTFPINGTTEKWIEFFEKLNKYFSLIHIHVNDNGIAQRRPMFCGVFDLLELTYIKKNDSLQNEYRKYPLDGLDFPNGYNINQEIDWWLN
jgi:hypothetical protein